MSAILNRKNASELLSSNASGVVTSAMLLIASLGQLAGAAVAWWTALGIFIAVAPMRIAKARAEMKRLKATNKPPTQQCPPLES